MSGSFDPDPGAKPFFLASTAVAVIIAAVCWWLL